MYMCVGTCRRVRVRELCYSSSKIVSLSSNSSSLVKGSVSTSSLLMLRRNVAVSAEITSAASAAMLPGLMQCSRLSSEPSVSTEVWELFKGGVYFIQHEHQCGEQFKGGNYTRKCGRYETVAVALILNGFVEHSRLFLELLPSTTDKIWK